MKTLTIFSIALVVLAAAPVFACGGGSGDKGKDDQAFTINVQTLCGGDKGDKSGDKDATAYLCNKPKPEPEPEPQCGGDKGNKPEPEPQLLCGGSGKDKDKDETKT